MTNNHLYKKVVILILNLGLLFMISSGSGPACGWVNNENPESNNETPWEKIAEDNNTGMRAWSNEDSTLIISSVSATRMKHEDALNYCENLSIGDLDKKFRVPSEQEFTDLLATFKLETLPDFRWVDAFTRTDNSQFKAASFWLKETHTALEGHSWGYYFAWVVPVKDAGRAVNIYWVDELDKANVYFGAISGTNPKGDAAVICVADL